MMFGLVNVVRCCCAPARAAGGGAGPLLGLAGAAVVAVLGYRFLEASLLGMRNSAAAANVALAWGSCAVALVVLITLAVWFLINRRHEVVDRPIVAEHEARMLAATTARREAIAAPPAGARNHAPDAVRVPAERVDRVARGGRR